MNMCQSCGRLAVSVRIGGHYYCGDHAAAAKRKQAGILATSRAMMGNQNAKGKHRKRK